MKSNNGILTEKEIQRRTKFWNKKQFRTWSKKELERTSTDMQKLLLAIKEFSLDEIEDIRNSDVYSFRAYGKNDLKYTVCMYVCMYGSPKGYRLRYFNSSKNF